MGKYSIRSAHNRTVFVSGMKGGIPIGLGYLAVSFSLGIAAKNAGLTPFQGFLASLLCNASAGEYVGFTLIAAGAGFIELATAIFIANARYILMSCAMSQRADPDMPFIHRFLMAFHITDELFGLAISRQGYLNPYYSYGAVMTSAPFWAIGTALGVIAGSMLPIRLVSAFSVALYGMFLAVIVPAAKGNRVIAVLIIFCFALSLLFELLPGVRELSAGTRTIILTAAISSAAAILFPHGESEKEGQ